ncbi:MAG: TonB-dependent receptor [Marinilabiliaceae bacterium]|nr:TonB-dependent receptor [Marinilabiliaceae bacterium]
MKKYLYILFIFTCLIHAGYSQKPVTIALENRPMLELFEFIEKYSDYRIYCTPEVSDSLTVTINETNIDPLLVIQKALHNTDFQFSLFQNNVYIIKNRTLITKLPGSFYMSSQDSAEDDTLPEFDRETKAVSETLIYAIGNSALQSTTNVIMTGTVTNSKTGEPVPGVTLLLENPLTGTTTDAYGFYSIRLPPGRQEIIIRGMGLKESKRQLMLFSDGKLDIELVEQVLTLSEVTVFSDKVDNIRSVSGGLERLQMRNIKNIPTIMGEADVIRIVMALPGVKSAGEISSGFNVRGGATDQNLILFNEGTIYAPTHMFGLFSIFNPDIVDNMELYKSNIPAKYGGRISSVLEINTREGNKKEFKGVASIGLLTSRLTLEAPLFKGKGSFIVGGRTTYSDWMLRLVPEKSGYSNGSAAFYDLNGSMNYKIDDNNTIYLSGYYSFDRFNFSPSDRYSYQNLNVSAKWRHIINQKITSSFVVGHDHYSYANKDTNDIFNAYTLDFAINQTFGKADFNYYFDNNHTINIGINTILYNLNPGNIEPSHSASLIQKRSLQTEKALESAFYISDQWEINPLWMVSAGIRYSMFNAFGPRTYNIYSTEFLPSTTTVLQTDSVGGGLLKTWHGPEFRFSLRYIINEKTSIKGGVNSMRQYIHKISNTLVMSPTDTWKLSDVNIRPQTGIQYTVGLFRNFAQNKIETSVETYYKTMNNYLDYRGGAELIMNSHIETEVAGVKGEAYGVELMLKKNHGKLNGWVSYTYSRTLLKRHEEMKSMMNTSDWYPADFDKPHEIKFVGNFKITHRYSFSLNCDYSTGRPITLPISKYEISGNQYLFYSERNKFRIPDFFRMDASFNIESGHRLTKLTHGYFTIGVYNLTGRKNAYSIYYTVEDGQIRGYQLSIFGVPVPYVSYNIRF